MGRFHSRLVLLYIIGTHTDIQPVTHIDVKSHRKYVATINHKRLPIKLISCAEYLLSCATKIRQIFGSRKRLAIKGQHFIDKKIFRSHFADLFIYPLHFFKQQTLQSTSPPRRVSPFYFSSFYSIASILYSFQPSAFE